MKKKTTKRKVTKGSIAKAAKQPTYFTQMLGRGIRVGEPSPFKAALAARDFKAELRRIVDFLNVGDMGAEQLWAVLSALRGPDVEHSTLEVKTATTCVIRRAIGLNAGVLPASVRKDDKKSVDIRNMPVTERARLSAFIGAYTPLKPIISYHFDHHAKTAFNALGLKWDELNTDEVKI